MSASLMWLLVLGLSTPAEDPELIGTIRGTTVNGSQGGTPLGQAEVVLRAQLPDGSFAIAATTFADDAGRFEFSGLPVVEQALYLPGVNHQGIHYPGQRLRLTEFQTVGEVRLVALDAVSSPGVLVCRQHRMHLRPGAGFVEVQETLVIENPTQTTYVGTRGAENLPVTLRLAVPHGLEKVTFVKELHGRNFQFTPDGLATQMPWLPGEQEVSFVYRVPVDGREFSFRRTTDLDTNQVQVLVDAAPEVVRCNLPAVEFAHSSRETASAAEFGSGEGVLPAGHQVELLISEHAVAWETHARWFAVAGIVTLMAATAFVMRPRARSRS